jgi:transposase
VTARVQTFWEQVPGVLDDCQRRTARLSMQVSAVARELAGWATARLLPALGLAGSLHTMLRALVKIALAAPLRAGIDDFALRRTSIYATVLIDAETGQCFDAVEGRTASIAEKWLSDHRGAQVVCRDGSGAYGEAVRRHTSACEFAQDRCICLRPASLANAHLTELNRRSRTWLRRSTSASLPAG